MTVSSDLNKISYAGNGTTTVFAVNYYFLADSHLQVVLITADGTETVQTLTTNYTVSGAGNPAGGSVTMLVAPPTGTTVVIQREVPATQETDYLANDPFPAESHERALDKLTMLVQQNERENERALKIPLSAVPTTSTELPIPVGNKLLAWNSDASAVTNFDPSDVITIVGQQTSYGDTFTGNGVTTDFTLTRQPGSVFGIDVSINGVTQVPNADYILSGTTLSFTTAPPAAASQILARYAEVYQEVDADAQNVRYLPAGTGAELTTVQAKLRETVSVKDFGAVGDGVADDTAAIQAAVAATNTSGQWLFWNQGTYRITSALSFTLTQMRWKAENAVILVDTTGDILRGVNVTLSDAAEHQLLGSGFEVNANGKCHGALRFIQPLGTQTASIYLEKVGARNVEMQVGAGVGSSGLDVRGGFKQAKLVDCYADNIMMRTGAGVIGSSGVTGIILQNNFGTTGAYIKNMILVRPTVNRVYSQDLSYQFDMDGIGLVANPSDDTFGPAYAEVTSSDISGCWGRDIKMQTSACKIDSPNSLLNQGPSGGINNPTYDFQTGSGLLIGGQYTIDNVAVTSLVAFKTTTAGLPMSSHWVGGSVDIINGGSVNRVIDTDSIGVVTKFVATVSNVNVNGEIQNFALQRTNGFDIHTIKLDGIVCSSITEALVRVIAGTGGSAPYRGIVYVKNCIHLGSDIPTVSYNVPGNGANVLLDDVGGIGFGPNNVTMIANATTVSGLTINNSANLPISLTNSNSGGTEKLYSFVLADGAEISLPSHGFNNTYLAEIVMAAARNTLAYIGVDNGGIDTIHAGAQVQIGTTSDPGSGSLRIWRNTGTAELVVKNASGSLRIFLARFIG